MKRGWVYLPFLYFLCLGVPAPEPVWAGGAVWTEEKIGKLAVKADRAAKHKNWARAIKYGEKMLEASAALYQKSDPDYINRLKTLNRYYDKAGRLSDVSERVKQAYILSKEHLGLTHNTSNISRLLYYKSLIADRDYQGAISLVRENISILGASNDDGFKRLHYLEQLFSLYGLTNQRDKEEQTLLEMLTLNKHLIGDTLNDNLKIILDLGKNYCIQNKIQKYNNLMQEYDLTYTCPFQ